MSLIALLPVVVFVVGAAAVAIAVTRVLDEVQQLRMELEQARRLRPLVAEVGDEALRLRLVLHRIGRR